MISSKTDAETLAAELTALELSPAERAALDAVFDAASDSDVEAFSLNRGNRYLQVLLAGPRPQGYIGETEKNVAVFEPKNQT